MYWGARPLRVLGTKIVKPVVVRPLPGEACVSYGSTEELRATRTPCSTLDRSFHRAELRPFREFLMFARPPRDDASPSGEPWPREGRVRAGATGSVNLSDNRAGAPDSSGATA